MFACLNDYVATLKIQSEDEETEKIEKGYELLTCSWRNHHSLECVGNHHISHTSFGGESLLEEVLHRGHSSVTGCAFQAKEVIW